MLRWVELLGTRAFSPDQSTQTVDIPLTVKIAALKIGVQGVTNATGPITQHLLDQFPSVSLSLDETVDLFNQPLPQLAAISILELRRLYPAYVAYTVNTTVWYETVIPFGRSLYDPSLYLDPSLYRSVKLRVTSNPTTGAGGFTSGQMKLWVSALVGDEGDFGTRVGTLRNVTRAKRVGVANAKTFFELPPTGRVKSLYFLSPKVARSLYAGTINQVTVTIKDDLQTIFNGSGSDLQNFGLGFRYPLDIKEASDTDDSTQTRPGNVVLAGALTLPFDYQDVPDRYLDLAQNSRVRVYVTEGSTPGEYHLVTREVLS